MSPSKPDSPPAIAAPEARPGECQERSSSMILRTVRCAIRAESLTNLPQHCGEDELVAVEKTLHRANDVGDMRAVK
jgi:hypothetical protein